MLYTIQIDQVAEEILQLEILCKSRGNGTTEIDSIIQRRENAGNTTTINAVATGQGAGSNPFTIAESIVGQEALNSGITVTVTTNNNAPDADVIAGGNGAGFTNIVASVDSTKQSCNRTQ